MRCPTMEICIGDQKVVINVSDFDSKTMLKWGGNPRSSEELVQMFGSTGPAIQPPVYSSPTSVAPTPKMKI